MRRANRELLMKKLGRSIGIVLAWGEWQMDLVVKSLKLHLVALFTRKKSPRVWSA